MAHTIFILGTDPRQCKDLKEILQERITDHIVTTHNEENLPAITESDTVIITAEEKNTGVLYRRLLNKLEEQVHRAELLSELIRLFSSSLKINELLEQVVSKSTDVLGDTSFIVLAGDTGELKLEAIYDRDRERLVRMLISTINMAPDGLSGNLIAGVMNGTAFRTVRTANTPPPRISNIRLKMTAML